MKATNVIIFQIINEGLIVPQILGFLGLNIVMNGKMFSFDDFLGFLKSFCGIERAFWNPCFISESG